MLGQQPQAGSKSWRNPWRTGPQAQGQLPGRAHKSPWVLGKPGGQQPSPRTSLGDAAGRALKSSERAPCIACPHFPKVRLLPMYSMTSYVATATSPDRSQSALYAPQRPLSELCIADKVANGPMLLHCPQGRKQCPSWAILSLHIVG